MLLAALDALQRALMTARESLWSDSRGKERRALLYLLCAIEVLLLAKRADKEGRHEYLKILSVLLHEPLDSCRRLLHRQQAALLLLEHRRNRQRQGYEIRFYRESIHWHNAKDFLSCIRSDDRARIFAAYHFGDYIHGLSSLAKTQELNRRRLLIRLERGSAESEANQREDYRQLGLKPPDTILSDEVDPLQLRALLRREPVNLTTFCDLSADFGDAVEVEFMGRRAWFACGAARLAIAAGVPVMPVICWYDGRNNCLEVLQCIEPARYPGESFNTAARRITQLLVRHLECFLRRFPEQWRYLAQLPLYFQDPGTKQTEMAGKAGSGQ